MNIRTLFSIALPLLFSTSVLSGCGSKDKDNNDADKVKSEANIPIDNDLRGRLEDFADKPRPRGAFGFHVYDLTADKPANLIMLSSLYPSPQAIISSR